MPVNNPSTSLYQLGRGAVTIAEWDGDTPPTGGDYETVGNSPRFEVEVNEEKLDHYSSQAGTRVKDKSVVLETGYSLNFDLDEVSTKNLARYLRATISGAKNHILLANMQLSKEFALKFVSDNPAGPNETWEFWKMLLSPGGPFNLISDDWSMMSFTAEGLADVANKDTSPYFTVTYATTTTT